MDEDDWLYKYLRSDMPDVIRIGAGLLNEIYLTLPRADLAVYEAQLLRIMDSKHLMYEENQYDDLWTRVVERIYDLG